MKRKVVSKKDIQTWKEFISNLDKINIENKDFFSQISPNINKTNIIDLHGVSLSDANNKVIKFINDSYKKGYKKLKIITGKGNRSNHYENPYLSNSLSTLKNSVRHFLKNNEISKKIKKITVADKKDGGDGAFYIFLRK